MSAVTAYAGTDFRARTAQKQVDGLAPVIDIAKVRRQRTDSLSGIDDADALSSADRIALEHAMLRHPASRGLRSVKSVSTPALTSAPVRYVTRVPVYAKAIGWTAAVALAVSGGIGLGTLLNPGTYQGQTWTHTVASGESLWGVAASLGSSRALEDVVEDIRVLNGLTDATLIPGQELAIPVK